MARGFLLLVALSAGAAHASAPVDMVFPSATLGARYSQGINLEVSLATAAGAVDGTSDCGASPCRVSFEMKASDDSGSVILITEPDVVVDAAGRARARLTLVDGRHGGAAFESLPDGFAYTITARFRGAGVPLPDVTDPDCQGTGVDGDGRLCPQVATATLVVQPEVPALEFAQDIVMGIGETVTLAATIIDESGNADAAGDAIDGTSPVTIEGVPIRFFYDVDADGRPSLDERLGEATTNAFGVAAFDFTADPSFVTAGTFNAGLHAEFPGDSRYAVARTSVRVTINASGPDPARTIIEVTPDTLVANGVDEAVIRVRLVDENGNLLGPDADDADVAITADLGRLIDDVERDALDGTYSQVLRTSREGGTASITVTVNGEPAGDATVTIEGREGCTCSTLSGSAPVWVAMVALGLAPRRRRRSS